MKASEIKVGGRYVAKVGENLTTVRVDGVRGKGYDVTNLATLRKTYFRSAAKFRSTIRPCPKCGKDLVYGCRCGKAEMERQLTEMRTGGEFETAPLPTPEIESYEIDEDGNEVQPAAPPIPRQFPPGTVQAEKPIVKDNGNGTFDITQPLTVKPGVEQRRPFAEPTAPAQQSAPLSPTCGNGSSGFGLAGAIKQSAPAPHVQVQALAGTGKTTTLVEGMKKLKGLAPAITPSPQQAAVWEQMALGKNDSIRFAAFGKAIATELQSRLTQFGLDKRGCDAGTFHSLGCRTLNKAFGRQDANNAAWVVMDITAEIMGGNVRDMRKDAKQNRTLKAVDELVSLCKQNLCAGTTEELDALTSRFDVDTNGVASAVYELVPKVLEQCKNPKGRITFDDMVWLPVVHNLTLSKADILLVDEVQDLNRMQQELAYKAANRIIMVGDRNQAIFGFAGADAESMDRMRERLNAVALPLTVTRRCGKAIVREANQYVANFAAHESNCEGAILTAFCNEFRKKDSGGTDKPDYKANVRDGDFVLCRTNAPLVQQCFRFLRAGRKANIQGRDIGRGLISTVEKVCKEPAACNVANFLAGLSDWLAAEQAKEMAKRYPVESKIEALQDRHDCLACFTDGARTGADVIAKINSVFTDDKVSPGVKLASIHRSKGLEAKNVFLLCPPTGPREDKMQPWERQQETNLRYVAITRAIETLTYVS